jgi:hypothetical protein
MATTSLNILNIENRNLTISEIYDQLNKYEESNENYFILNLISNNELSGKYIYVQNVEQQIYNIEARKFESQIIPKAVTIPFDITNNKILVWANKSNVNRLIYTLTNVIKGIILSSVNIPISNVLLKINKQNTKITKICLLDIALVDDLVGKFYTDLYSYGDSYGILRKYKNQIEKITFQYYIMDTFLTITLNDNGNITLYKCYDNIDDEQLDFLKKLFIE